MNRWCICFALVLCGCASIPTSKKASRATSLFEVSDVTSASEIKNDLRRASLDGIAVQVVGYYAEAFPYSRPFIEAKNRELCKKNFESPESCRAQTDKEMKSFYSERSCLMLTLRTMEIAWAEAKSWKVKYEQPLGAIEEGNLSNFDQIPRANLGDPRPWENTGLVCFDKKIDFSKEFVLHVIPQFGGAEMKSLLLTWQAPGASK